MDNFSAYVRATVPLSINIHKQHVDCCGLQPIYRSIYNILITFFVETPFPVEEYVKPHLEEYVETPFPAEEKLKL